MGNSTSTPQNSGVPFGGPPPGFVPYSAPGGPPDAQQQLQQQLQQQQMQLQQQQQQQQQYYHHPQQHPQQYQQHPPPHSPQYPQIGPAAHSPTYQYQQQQHQQLQQVRPGGYGGAYAPPQVIAPPPPPPPQPYHHHPQQQQQQQQHFYPPPTAIAGGAYGQFAPQPTPQPPRQVQTHDAGTTVTVTNRVHLNKSTLRLEPVAGKPDVYTLAFSFDAAAPCRVTTFLLATEDPDDGCRLASAVCGAPPRRPVAYDKGAGLKFPPAGHSAAADSHQVDLRVAPMGHMTLAAGNSYPLIIRLETAADGGSGGGTGGLDSLEPGGALPEWAQAQTTYAKLVPGRGGGRPEVRVLKQKIFVAGASYELQEIYGLDGGKANGAAAAASTTADGADGGGGDDSGGGGGGADCVICLSAPRDTTVLPCRHMCLCRDCGLLLKDRSDKCPICRETIESLLHLQLRPAPAAAARA